MRSIFALARQAALDVEALVLPVACLGCARALPDGAGMPLCGPCRLSVRPIGPPHCARCGQTLDPWELKRDGRWPMADGTSGTASSRVSGSGPSAEASPRTDATSAIGHQPSLCGFCRTWPDALAWAASAAWFDGVARELVHALKYGGWRVAAGPMARLMMRHLAGRLGGTELLVPVPLGRRRLRERGYNQAAALAQSLADLSGVTLAADGLRRSRETRTQTALDPAARRENVAGAFQQGRGIKDQVSGKRVVLVDDVLTTGATLVAAAEALRAAGAAEVGAVTFARAAKPE